MSDEATVKKKLEQLEADKAAGSDDMSPRFLRELKKEICMPLTIMRASLEERQILDDWKSANVNPIFKKGNKRKAENYHPVSLTSQICRLFESIIRNVIADRLEGNGLIKDSQHGLRRGKSCLSNLIQFLDKVTSGIDDGNLTNITFLDCAKVFDKVPHTQLSEKVYKHGIRRRIWN